MWVPKNTKVRATFREVLDNVHGFELPEASEEDEGSRMCGAGVNDSTDTADSQPLRPAGQIAHTASRKGAVVASRDTKLSENVDPQQSTVM